MNSRITLNTLSKYSIWVTLVLNKDSISIKVAHNHFSCSVTILNVGMLSLLPVSHGAPCGALGCGLRHLCLSLPLSVTKPSTLLSYL
jgi:hypothetical protein